MRSFSLVYILALHFLAKGYQLKICSQNVDEIDYYWSQFHQHFMSSFCPNFLANIISTIKNTNTNCK